jgi:coenzyme F420-reducing hydrogenase delta subunit
VEHSPNSPEITMFLCANCAQPSRQPASGNATRFAALDFHWPVEVQQILVPCTGRLQPEHVLKAFESGASIVSVVGCREEHCCFLEGSKRCVRRVDFIRSILMEIGLGAERLMLFHLPGSAGATAAFPAGDLKADSSESSAEALDTQLTDIRDQVMKAFHGSRSSPLRLSTSENPAGISPGKGAG